MDDDRSRIGLQRHTGRIAPQEVEHVPCDGRQPGTIGLVRDRCRDEVARSIGGGNEPVIETLVVRHPARFVADAPHVPESLASTLGKVGWGRPAQRILYALDIRRIDSKALFFGDLRMQHDAT